MSDKVDYPALWFRLAERGGECPLAPVGWLGADGAASGITWHHHADQDGLGTVLRAIEERGQVPPPAPQYNGKAPGLLVWLWAFVRYVMRGRPPVVARIRGFDPQFRRTTADAARPVARAWTVLSASQTQALDDHAKAHGVSTNTWLLTTLDRALRPQFTDPKASSHWLMPVNLRGAVTTPHERANAAGSLGIVIAPGEEPKTVHQHIKRAMQRHEHWIAWWFLNLGRWVSTRTMIRMAQLAPPFTGVFTNLGVWTVDNPMEPLLAFPPTFSTYPLGVAAVVWNGQRILTMTAHPALIRDESVLQAWLQAWHSQW